MSRVAVVGGGAMGGLWAGLIGADGHDVTVVDVSTELVEAIEATGITVVEADGSERQAAVAATTDTRQAGRQGVVFLFVKGPHTRSAAATLAPLLDDDTIVATLQNGWGNADAIAESVPRDRLVIGVTYQSATIGGPGRVLHLGAGPSDVGAYIDGGDLGPAEAVAALMSSAGLETAAAADVKTAIWRKLIHNAACLPISALTDLRTASLVDPGAVRDLIDDLAREATAVAQALGLDVDPVERIERIHAVLGAAGMGVPSMLADVHARRPTEVETINGAVVRAGREVGVEVPLNAAMVALVQGLERSWQPADG